MVVKSPDVAIDSGESVTNNPIAPTNDSSSPSNSHNNNYNNNRFLQSAAEINTNQLTKSTSDSNNSTAQHIDSAKMINKNSLRLDLESLNESMKQDVRDTSPKSDIKKRSVKRNFSMISFKSLDFNLKSFCSSMKSKHGRDSNGGGSSKTTTPQASGVKTCVTTTTNPPYLKVETVDQDVEEEHLLISFPQSPYSHRGSFDKTQSQHLTATHSDYSRSQANSPFLSINTSQNIRRSSTSDIIDKKPVPPSNATPTASRRPSTSDLLRRARERKGSETKGGEQWSKSFSLLGYTNYIVEQIRYINNLFCLAQHFSNNKMGRSTSHGGLPRAGGRMGRRTSMAF